MEHDGGGTIWDLVARLQIAEIMQITQITPIVPNDQNAMEQGRRIWNRA